jgi:hypothetical protein
VNSSACLSLMLLVTVARHDPIQTVYGVNFLSMTRRNFRRLQTLLSLRNPGSGFLN